MPLFDDQLPLNPIDFRQFAPTVIQQEDATVIREAAGTAIRTRAVAIGVGGLEATTANNMDRLVDLGIEAARKVSANPGVVLSEDEQLGYEAVVRLTDRPALLIKDDRFAEPPPRWKHLDNPFRREIEALIPSVGRIDARNDGKREMVGTGFVVSADLVMTNTHVIEEFADPAPDFQSWSIRTGAEPTIDFKAEHGGRRRKAFRIKEIVTAFDRNDSERLKSLDLALLRVDARSFEPTGERLPAPVRLSRQAPLSSAASGTESSSKEIYLIGYPWTDNEGLTPPTVLAEIFGGIVKMKRLQPGEYGANFATALSFSHDSSTLGGNSGSFVADLSSGLIIGLHFRGKYRQANYALQLWALQNVDGIRGKGLNFTD